MEVLQGDITRLLNDARPGENGVLDQLVPVLYEELRRLAHRRLAAERADHTLNTTALVHEVYLKLAGGEEMRWESRRHFFATAALAMRRVLINYAHQHRAAKRGSGALPAPVDVDAVEAGSYFDHLSAADLDHVVHLEEALQRLEQFNARGAQVIAYHYFVGLTFDEIADVMALSPSTVRRSWTAARSWLRRELGEA